MAFSHLFFFLSFCRSVILLYDREIREIHKGIECQHLSITLSLILNYVSCTSFHYNLQVNSTRMCFKLHWDRF